MYSDKQNFFLAIATGLEHAVLLDYNQIVYCWGNNEHGQLGTGNNLSNFIYKEHNLPPIRQISCGQFCTLALSYDNEVWFWGRQYNVSVRGKIRAVPIQITFPDYINIESITAGCGDAAVVDSEGTVYVWGFNGCGQLGLGHRNIVSDPKPVRIFNGCMFVIIGRNRTAFVTQSGEFYISGSDRSLEDFELQSISFPGKITSIAAAWGKDLFAITNDLGEVLRWGHDAPSTATTKTNCTNIVEVFKDFWTPTVLPINVDSRQGIIKHIAPRRCNPTRVTGAAWLSQPAPDTTSTITLTSSVPKSDCASAKVGGCIDVSDQFNEQICSDLTIKLSDDSIHAHKLVLYMKSKYFKSLLEKSSKD
uniref:BTB domain-containing protein n=1 Tax=Rhodnius prolixus TaxID=13249 RepID=T1I683_RHOPR